MKVVTIVGARPQFIKAAMLSQALRAANIEHILIHTGQHYDEDMSNSFFRELDIPAPKINLAIGSGPHGMQTGRMLERLEATLLTDPPDMAIVFGDTNSTLAGALAAVKLHVPVAHVEAGLRSFDRRMPEEVNRVLTDHASDLLFAPTSAAVNNLAREGIAGSKIHLSGDVMFDAALHYGAKSERECAAIAHLGLKRREFLLVTLHRAENTDEDDRLEVLYSVLATIGKQIPIVMPLHPRTKAALLKKDLLDRLANSVRVIAPVGYLDMMMLEKNARLILTDSGGVQKEAFFYRVPCVTLRDRTEWTELVESGWNRLAPLTNAAWVTEIIRDALQWVPRECESPFGDGHASERIVSIAHEYLSGHDRVPSPLSRDQRREDRAQYQQA